MEGLNGMLRFEIEAADYAARVARVNAQAWMYEDVARRPIRRRLASTLLALATWLAPA